MGDKWSWCFSLDISPAPIGAPIEYAHNILHVSDYVTRYKCDDMELPHTKGHTSNP